VIMKDIEYKFGLSRLNDIINSLDELRDRMHFQTEKMDEEFNNNLEEAIISLQDCGENLEADQAYVNFLKESKQ